MIRRHTFTYRDIKGELHEKTVEGELSLEEQMQIHNDFIKEMKSKYDKKVYVAVLKDKMLIVGCFETHESALKYSANSKNVHIHEFIIK